MKLRFGINVGGRVMVYQGERPKGSLRFSVQHGDWVFGEKERTAIWLREKAEELSRIADEIDRLNQRRLPPRDT